jgi:hypothetical protein
VTDLLRTPFLQELVLHELPGGIVYGSSIHGTTLFC